MNKLTKTIIIGASIGALYTCNTPTCENIAKPRAPLEQVNTMNQMSYELEASSNKFEDDARRGVKTIKIPPSQQEVSVNYIYGKNDAIAYIITPNKSSYEFQPKFTYKHVQPGSLEAKIFAQETGITVTR